MTQPEKQNTTDTSLMSETDAFGVAASMFGAYMPRFKALIRKLGSKGRERVINALIEVPLMEKDFRPVDKDEREAFLVGQSLLEAKMLMIMHSVTFGVEQKKGAPSVIAGSDPTNDEGENNNG